VAANKDTKQDCRIALPYIATKAFDLRSFGIWVSSFFARAPTTAAPVREVRRCDPSARWPLEPVWSAGAPVQPWTV
jgi:hypothetical protein